MRRAECEALRSSSSTTGKALLSAPKGNQRTFNKRKSEIMTHSTNYSDNWKFTDWTELQKVTFRLQRRIFKAVKTGDKARAKRLQKLVLSSYAARMLAIRQVTQLNAGKKTAGIDGKKSLTFEERFQLEKVLKKQVKNWKHKGLRGKRLEI